MPDGRKILWVAATPAELACVPVRAGWRRLATGCGPAAAGAGLGIELGNEPMPDLVVGVGVAGAYPGSGLALGAVVRVGVECFADLGCEDGAGFLDLCDLSIPGAGVEREYRLAEPEFLSRLEAVKAATCSVCTGSESTAMARVGRTRAAIESMEGAAWALACAKAQVPFAQVRSISNVAGPRDRSAWKLPEALESLANSLEDLCKTF